MSRECPEPRKDNRSGGGRGGFQSGGGDRGGFQSGGADRGGFQSGGFNSNGGGSRGGGFGGSRGDGSSFSSGPPRSFGSRADSNQDGNNDGEKPAGTSWRSQNGDSSGRTITFNNSSMGNILSVQGLPFILSIVGNRGDFHSENRGKIVARSLDHLTEMFTGNRSCRWWSWWFRWKGPVRWPWWPWPTRWPSKSIHSKCAKNKSIVLFYQASDDIFDQGKWSTAQRPSLICNLNCFWVAGARGADQPVERFIPPPPPTTEEDIFGEAVAKGVNFSKYHRTHVQCTPEGNEMTSSSFYQRKWSRVRLDKVKPIEMYEEANPNTQVLSNIRRAHFEEPTAIQRYTIPCIRQQDDLMACAQTGSGKTVGAFSALTAWVITHPWMI